MYHEGERLFVAATSPAGCCSSRREQLLVTSHRVVHALSTPAGCGGANEDETNMFLRDVQGTVLTTIKPAGSGWLAAFMWLSGLSLLVAGLILAITAKQDAVSAWLTMLIIGPAMLAPAFARTVMSCGTRKAELTVRGRHGDAISILLMAQQAREAIAVIHYLREDIAPLRATATATVIQGAAAGSEGAGMVFAGGAGSPASPPGYVHVMPGGGAPAPPAQVMIYPPGVPPHGAMMSPYGGGMMSPHGGPGVMSPGSIEMSRMPK